MKPLRIQFAAADAPQTQLDRAIEWVLIALLAFCPFAFAAVEAWSEAIFIFLACAIVICFAVKMIKRPDARFVWSWSYLPIGLFVLLVIFQLIPLPASVIRLISPATASLKSRLLHDLPGGDAAARWMTLSFYPEATLRQLREILAIAALFIVVINVFQTVESIRRLLIAIVIIGLGEALLALAQDLSGTTRLYWTFTVYEGRALSGSFVNHSHFGQFMNLTIGAAVALMLLEWHASNRRAGFSVHGVVDMPAESGTSMQTTLLLSLAIAAIVACAIALLLSLTRGGVISMLVAGAMLLVILRIKAPSRRTIVAGASLLVAAIVIVVAWIGFEKVYYRLASTTEANASNWRGQMLRDLTRAWKQFPVFGTGLGTHPVIFPMYDHSEVVGVASHAENEYAQAMTETGAIGLAAILAFGAMIWLKYVRSIRGHFSSIGAMAIGLGYGLAAVMIHSFSDFGQHFPAVASLTAVTCALLVSLWRLRRQRGGNTRAPEEFHGSAPLRVGIGAVVTIACAVAIFQSARTWAAESEFKTAQQIEQRLRSDNWDGDNTEFAEMIIHAQNAHDIRPGNVDYAYWLAFYRWKWISVQPEMMTNPEYLGYARRIADELNRVRLTCPTFGLPASCAGQIEEFVLHDPRGTDDIRIGSELNRNDPTAVFVDGQLAASEGDWPRSLDKFKHYLEISPGGAIEVVDLYVNQFHRPDLALKLADGDLAAIQRLAGLLEASGEDPQTLATANQQAGDLLLARASLPDATAGALMTGAQVAAERGDHDTAILYLRRAITMNSDPALRVELARELRQIGKKPEAIEQLQIALRQRRGYPEAQKLLKELKD